MSTGKLTPRQRAFVAAYAGNATQAAIAAGYSAATAQQAGSRLLCNVVVAAAIRAREGQRTGTAIASREQRQAFWTATMQSVETDIGARLKASELLGKSEADFTDKIEHSGALTLEQAVAASLVKL